MSPIQSCDNVKLSKYKNIFEKVTLKNKPEEVFVIKNFKNTIPWIYVISDLNGKEIVGTFKRKKIAKNNSQEFRVEKVI